MRDHELIEREIYRAREDLEQSLSELKHAVAEKTDVKARARVALDRSRQAAQDYAARGRDHAVGAFTYVQQRPALVGGIVAGVVAIGALAYIGRRRGWW